MHCFLLELVSGEEVVGRRVRIQDMDAREGLVARHLGETVDKLKKKARTLTRLNETKTRDWGMEQRQNVTPHYRP